MSDASVQERVCRHWRPANCRCNKEWLRLLPFTEQPAAILQVLERAEGFRDDPQNLRSVLAALSYAPSVEAEAVLKALAKRDERFLSEDAWITALTKRNTLTAARIILDLICTGSLPTKDGWVGKHLVGFMTTHDEFRQEVYERFSSTEDDSVRAVLAYAITNAPDIDGILALVRVASAHNQAFQATGLHGALREIILEYRPIASSNIQEVFSVPVPGLRKGLFKLFVNGSPAEKRLGADCLTAIDQLRDEYGRADSEPRHPDIASGIPWPNAAGEVSLVAGSSRIPLMNVNQHIDGALSIGDDMIRHLAVGSPEWRRQTARNAANVRHDQPGGSRDKQQQIRDIWATGKYSSRDRCAEEECGALASRCPASA